MTFGEKLKALLKEKGMTQEELSERLDVSRQAVGKWANDKGLPEVDKLIQISNIFGVSLDYLLKEEQIENVQQWEGYYVSKETIDGFLSYKQQGAKRIVIGISLLILSNLVDCFMDFGKLSSIIYWLMTATGIAVLLWNYFLPKKYQEIRTKQLLFDDAVIKEFRIKYEKRRKMYAAMIIAGVVVLFLSSEITLFIGDYFERNVAEAMEWILNTVWVDLFIAAGISMRAESLIANNGERALKSEKRGKHAWIYAALPVTAFLVVIGLLTNAWRPVVPIIVLFCALLVTVCKLIIESRGMK
ncbi:MAG: helix-turn-helix transcriptional regulator [Lachnospiraceae bacterium]|nr:helix-turn-helix transcriptional regulator [Lachnospiraceae bacterium]